MLCPHCGVEVPDESRTCPKCRAQLAFGNPVLAATDLSRDTPRQEQQIRRLALALAAALVAAALGVFVFFQARRQGPQSIRAVAAPSQPVVVSSVVIGKKEYVSYQFAVGANCKSPELFGHWQTSGMGARLGTVSVLREVDFMNWKQHRPATAISSQKLEDKSLRLRLPVGGAHYYLVMTNTTASPQSVVADIRQDCGS